MSVGLYTRSFQLCALHLAAMALPYSASSPQQKPLKEFNAGSMQSLLDTIDLNNARFAVI